jgi:hypothetical protein
VLSLFASECRLVASGEWWIAKKQGKEQNKQIQKLKKRTGGVLSFFPPLPLARELKAGLAINKRSRGLRTSPVSWLGGTSSPDFFEAGTQPSRGAAHFRAIGRSGLRACFFRLTVARRRRLCHIDPG